MYVVQLRYIQWVRVHRYLILPGVDMESVSSLACGWTETGTVVLEFSILTSVEDVRLLVNRG